MKRRTGLYPGVQVDAAACGVVSQAGGVALLEAVTVSGLDRLLSVGLEPWRAPRAVHDPAKVLLDLAVTLALGAAATFSGLIRVVGRAAFPGAAVQGFPQGRGAPRL